MHKKYFLANPSCSPPNVLFSGYQYLIGFFAENNYFSFYFHKSKRLAAINVIFIVGCAFNKSPAEISMVLPPIKFK